MIAVTDFVCWFPICVLGLVAASGYTIPEEWNIAITIFILPLNAAFNPFLYTFNVIIEKRKKLREGAILKRMVDEMKVGLEIVPEVQTKEDAIRVIRKWTDIQLVQRDDLMTRLL